MLETLAFRFENCRCDQQTGRDVQAFARSWRRACDGAIVLAEYFFLVSQNLPPVFAYLSGGISGPLRNSWSGMEALDQVLEGKSGASISQGRTQHAPLSADAADGSVVLRLIPSPKDNSGQPLTGAVTLTFWLYAEQEEDLRCVEIQRSG
jgi:hypothetical protein